MDIVLSFRVQDVVFPQSWLSPTLYLPRQDTVSPPPPGPWEWSISTSIRPDTVSDAKDITRPTPISNVCGCSLSPPADYLLRNDAYQAYRPVDLYLICLEVQGLPEVLVEARWYDVSNSNRFLRVIF